MENSHLPAVIGDLYLSGGDSRCVALTLGSAALFVRACARGHATEVGWTLVFDGEVDLHRKN